MIALLLALAFADVLVDAEPALAQPVHILVVDDLSRPVVGTTVRVVFAEGLAGASEITIGTTDARGQVPWAPEQSGRARLVAGRHEAVVRVRGPIDTSTLTLLALLLLSSLAAMGMALPALRRS